MELNDAEQSLVTSFEALVCALVDPSELAPFARHAGRRALVALIPALDGLDMHPDPAVLDRLEL